MKYKVWADIEEHDETDQVEAESVGEPEQIGGTFDTQEEAVDFISRINHMEIEVKRLDGIVQTKAGECMKLTAARDDMRDLLEEVAGTFGEIGTDEPVNGGDTVDFLNDWMPRVRKLLATL